MKTLLRIFILMLLFSCKDAETFKGTTKYFQTDKPEYCPGDTINLTTVIESDTERKIQIFKNYRNLVMTVVLKDTCGNNFGEDCHGLVPQNIAGKEKSDIEEFTISPGHPYKKTFIGILGTDSEHHSVTFPELKHFAHIKMDTTSDVTIIGIVGRWHSTDRQEFEYKEGDIPLKEVVIKNGCL